MDMTTTSVAASTTSTQYSRVVIEADTRGRLTISTLDADGYGGGHRFCGPKQISDAVAGIVTPVAITHDLDGDDARELVHCARVLDEILLPGLPGEWAALADAQNMLRRALGAQLHFQRLGSDEHTEALQAQVAAAQAQVVAAAAALASALSASAPTS